MLIPDMFIQLSKARMVSPTGQCHTFSDKADGYTRGEGCGVVILKRLKDVGVNLWLFVTLHPVSAPSPPPPPTDFVTLAPGLKQINIDLQICLRFCLCLSMSLCVSVCLYVPHTHTHTRTHTE